MPVRGRLILVNGAPGVGKTALARRFLDDHPLALLVDIDGLRTSLGRWDLHDDSKVLARELAMALVECHLGANQDVVVPQFLGRTAFIERLEDVARHRAATFVEVMLVAPPAVAAARFRDRRTRSTASPMRHPEADVADDDVDEVVADAVARLAAIAGTRRATRTVTADGSPETIYRALLDALGDTPPHAVATP